MRTFPRSLALLVLVGCGGEDAPAEGTAAGDCSDAADNDADGLFDCDDDGCTGSPDCAGSDENAAPSGAAIAIEPAAPADADDLRCVIVTEATDPNGDAVTYAYAWTKNGADAGLTTDTVSEALTTGGDTWTCTVTPTDGALAGAPASATATVAQGNRAPSAPTVSISPAEPTDDDVLTCVIDTESVDPDGDTVSYAYAWSVDGGDAGITGATVNATLTEVGQQWTCAVTASDGELTSSAASVSVEVITSDNLVSISAGAGHTCVIVGATEGELYCWGFNEQGQIGNGTTAVSLDPSRVGTASNWVDVSAGVYHTCGINTYGELYCWGEDYYGQLGDGGGANKSTPVRVGTSSNWISVSTGGFHSCAVNASAELYCWGLNRWGQLGDGTSSTRSTPVRVNNTASWRSVEAGGEFTCAVTTDSALYCWGQNDDGQLGDATHVVSGKSGGSQSGKSGGF